MNKVKEIEKRLQDLYCEVGDLEDDLYNELERYFDYKSVEFSWIRGACGMYNLFVEHEGDNFEVAVDELLNFYKEYNRKATIKDIRDETLCANEY